MSSSPFFKVISHDPPAPDEQERLASTNVISLDSLSTEEQEQLAKALDIYISDLEQGYSPDIEALIRQYPGIADALRAYIKSLDYLHEATVDLHASGIVPSTSDDSSEKRLGDYSIIREIGRGGMGVVYEAKQISLDRQVALKVLPFAAVLDRRQITRFYNEAQAAAHLHHPNIVPIFSIGCDRGVHFYAMQYIEGQPLDVAISQLHGKSNISPRPTISDAPTETNRQAETADFASRPWKSFSEAASLKTGSYFQAVAKLGIEVAEALDHAHQCGVIHRDIKPANLLLDEQGKVWITDFGLARFSANGSLTKTGDVMGTVRYMSPEQISGKTNLIDQRTDIYSLGITLYELLTLRAAFAGSDRQDFLRWITDEEPIPPRQINTAIPFDLETILLKAIAKSPQDRYGTAMEMAEDIRHFLENKPVLARRAGLADRASKWAKRHKTLALTTAVLLAVILVGSVVSTLMIASEHAHTKAALAQAESNLTRAEKHFRQLREVVDRFGAHHAERLKYLPGAESLRRELLGDTLNYYREFIRFASDDPSLQADLALTHSKAAAVIEQIGDKNEALIAYRQAAEILAKLADAYPNDGQYRADLALCRNNCGLLLSAMGKLGEAEEAYRQALEIQKRLIAEYPEADQYQNDLALTYGNFGLLENSVDRLPQGEQFFKEAIRLQKQLIEKFPDKPDHLHSLAVSYNNLSFLQAKKDPLKAEESSNDALSIQQKLVEKFPENAEFQSDLALSLNNLGTLENHNDRQEQAEASYRKAIAIQEQLRRKSPSVIHFRSDLAISYNNLGRVFSKYEHFDRAKTAFESAQSIMKELLGDYPEDLSYRSSLAGILNNLGMVLEQQHQAEDAAKNYEQAIENQRFAFEHARQVVQFRDFLGKHYVNYCRVLRSLGRHDEDIKASQAYMDLCQDDSEQLFRIAVELSEIAANITLKENISAGGSDSAALEKDSSKDASDRDKYLDMAMESLGKSLDAGLQNPERIKTDAGLTALRNCPKFETLLDRLTKTQK